MQRVKKPKKNQVQITKSERNKIVMMVQKKLFPLWSAIFITATKDVLNPSVEQVREIVKVADRYAGYHNDGLVNMHDYKKSIEKDLGASLEELLRCKE